MSKLKKFTCVDDIEDISRVLNECFEIKSDIIGTPHYGKNKTVGLVFMNPSLRTRISMQKACQNLGFDVVIINAEKDVWSWELEEGVVMNGFSVEHIKEAAGVLSIYCDILAIRCFPDLINKEADTMDRVLHQFIRYATVPVISMESATRHPLQSLADMITLKEYWTEPRKPKVVLTWAPHIKPIAHSVANSFCEWIKKMDADVTVAFPEGYELDEEFTDGLSITNHQDEALKDADFIYVKNWCSYKHYGAMPKVEADWMLTLDKLKQTNNAKVMHCLPVRRNVVISDEVLDSEQSLVYQQAANRLIAAQWALKQML